MILYIVVVVVMATATIIEKNLGSEYVGNNIYGAWWFSLLWALLTATSIFYFVKKKVRRPSTIVLHLSFVIILVGALLTHLTAERGIIQLRKGQLTHHYLTPDMQVHELPFNISLKQFDIKYYEGTNAPADYISHILIDNQPFTLSMNQIVSYKGIRLYQSNYDEDLQGSILAMNCDPWGIPVTYCGYALLFIALMWILIDPKGVYRQLLRRLSVISLLCLICGIGHANPRVLPEETAERFGQLFVVYNERVCPMQTYALDFTKKLYGKRHYQDFTAEQVLTGFIFFYEDWIQEPLKQETKAMKMNEKEILIIQLHQGTSLKIFPYSEYGKTTWYAPTSTLPDTMDEEHQKYIRNVFTLLNGEIQAGRYDIANQYLDKMLQYQQTFGQRSLPNHLQVRAERLYNSHPMTALLLGIPLRWIITGHFPLTNGYETMLVLAWLVALLSMVLYHHSRILSALGILLTVIFLLVSHISQMDPQMTPLMPVLNSPLLTLHVSVIMMAYALLSLTFISSFIALLMPHKRQKMHLLSQLMLFPALTFLGSGIFIGAIWANISWGTYWSWDPKETWALITFMIYAAPAHRSFSSRYYHIYMTVAFLTILMTYFGVNYFLGGMHAYA